MPIGTILEIAKLVLELLQKVETKDIVNGLYFAFEVLDSLPHLKNDPNFQRLKSIVKDLKDEYSTPDNENNYPLQ